jgi:glyoxylase-like metal-dependent hydrolase (beta-lactamase superfamily II)
MKLKLSLLTVFLVTIVGCSSLTKDDSEAMYGSACEKPVKIEDKNPKLVWTANHIKLISKKVGEGAYALYAHNSPGFNPKGVPAGTSSGFIVGDNGVLVIDSLLNAQLACQLLTKVREVTNKPILYVVNTSYHGDHAYGNYYFPKATKVVQHINTDNYLKKHLEADKKFMMQYFGTDQGIQDIQYRKADVRVNDKGITLDLGDRKVQVRYFGFAQTKGDLFVWDKTSKTMWTGNPYISEAPSLPWLLDGNLDKALNTFVKVRNFLPQSSTVVPGHGRPTKAADMNYTIEYLETLRGQVKDAISSGLSLDQTKDKVSKSMKKYSKYKLYDWVHTNVNVANTYKEYSKR